MSDELDKNQISWLERIRARSGLFVSKTDSSAATTSSGLQSSIRGDIINNGLKTEGARQAYERSIAKEKQRTKSNLREQLLDMPLTQLPVVIIDLETTGFEPQADSIISIGAWHITGTEWDENDGSYYEEVNPGMKIPSHIERLTGISNQMVANAAPIQEVLPRFLNYVDNRLVIAHGIGHDKAFLRTALWRCQKRTWNYRMLDTMLLAKWLAPQTKPFDLDSVMQHYDISVSHRHHALEDAKATGELWIRFVEQTLTKRVTTLRDMYMYLSRY